jgi:hypothetical protein
MQQVKMVPAMCDGVAYEGYVMLRNLSFDERIELFDTLGMDNIPEDDAAQKKMGYKLMAAVGKLSKDFVKEVSIRKLPDGVAMTDWNEIYHDSDFTSLVVEVCSSILGKIKAAS